VLLCLAKVRVEELDAEGVDPAELIQPNVRMLRKQRVRGLQVASSLVQISNQGLVSVYGLVQ
jgi:hypothetical protein